MQSLFVTLPGEEVCQATRVSLGHASQRSRLAKTAEPGRAKAHSAAIHMGHVLGLKMFGKAEKRVCHKV